MGFYSYSGISDRELDAQHTTSTGETYTLHHNESLKVEMQYLGKGNPSANAQGWERSSSRYFSTLLQNHPEMFSKKNEARVRAGHAPLVDQKMINSNPGWAGYRGQPLVHHHIGGDGEAVAVPKNAHKGRGEIHNAEKSAGITDNCKKFSKSCSMRPDSVGKMPSQLHGQEAGKGPEKGRGQADTRRGAGSGNPLVKGRSNATGSTRGRAASSASSRSESVRRAASEGNKENGTSRSESVRNHTAEAGESSGASRSISRGDCVRGSGEGKGTGSSQGNSQGASAGSGGSGQGHASGGGGQSRG